MNTVEQMVLDNQKLVYYFYNKLPKSELCILHEEDLIQEGMIGLWKGCKTFDETKGYKLATYLGTCINNQMRMYFRMLNKQPVCVSLDEVILNNDDPITLQDVLVAEDSYPCDLQYYIDLYFKYNRSTYVTRNLIPKIIQMLSEGYNQTDISKVLNTTHSNISRYVKKMREALKKETNA